MRVRRKGESSKARKDPLIDEVRAIRKDISDQFDNDVDRLCEHLKEVERRYQDRLVRRRNKRRRGRRQ